MNGGVAACVYSAPGRRACGPAGVDALPHWASLTRREREHCAAGLPRLDRYVGRIAGKCAVARLLRETSTEGWPLLDEVEIVRTSSGRPEIASVPGAAEGIRVSIAHRHGCAVAAAHRGGVGIGVDLVERQRFMRLRPETQARLAGRIMTAGEASDGGFGDDGLALAAALAVKEAVAKVLKDHYTALTWSSVSLCPPEGGHDLSADLAAAAGALSDELRGGRPRTGLVAVAPDLGKETIEVAWCSSDTWVAALALGRPRPGEEAAA